MRDQNDLSFMRHYRQTVRRVALLAAVFALLSTAKAGAADKPTAVAVYFTSSGAVSGFTDPSGDNVDSVRDIFGRVPFFKKQIVEAKDRKTARIVVTVVGRERNAAKGYIVRATFNCDDFEAPMSGTGANWTLAADDIVRQVAKWIQANRGKLQ